MLGHLKSQAEIHIHHVFFSDANPGPSYTPYDTEVRLVQNSTGYSSSGFVEVYLHGSWGPVCNMGFEDALSACRQLGYNWPVYIEDESG